MEGSRERFTKRPQNLFINRDTERLTERFTEMSASRKWGRRGLLLRFRLHPQCARLTCRALYLLSLSRRPSQQPAAAATTTGKKIPHPLQLTEKAFFLWDSGGLKRSVVLSPPLLKKEGLSLWGEGGGKKEKLGRKHKVMRRKKCRFDRPFAELGTIEASLALRGKPFLRKKAA